MKISEHSFGSVIVLDVEGSMTAEHSERPLVAAVCQLVSRGCVNILVNLEHVSRIDSSGLTELVDAYTATTSQGGQFKLEYVTTRVQTILRATRIDTVLEIFSEEAQALATFCTTDPARPNGMLKSNRAA